MKKIIINSSESLFEQEKRNHILSSEEEIKNWNSGCEHPEEWSISFNGRFMCQRCGAYLSENRRYWQRGSAHRAWH